VFLICSIINAPVIFLIFPETKGPSLEVATQFGDPVGVALTDEAVANDTKSVLTVTCGKRDSFPEPGERRVPSRYPPPG
jgi:hypothetical protein